MPACAGMTNQWKNHVVLGAAISYSVDERKLMTHFVVSLPSDLARDDNG
jgi:hypothetical protein